VILSARQGPVEHARCRVACRGVPPGSACKLVHTERSVHPRLESRRQEELLRALLKKFSLQFQALLFLRAIPRT
jgi:hypothetical protein